MVRAGINVKCVVCVWIHAAMKMSRGLGRGGSGSDPDMLIGTLCLWVVLQVPYDPVFRAPKEIHVLTVLDWKLPKPYIKPYIESIFIWVFMQYRQYV